MRSQPGNDRDALDADIRRRLERLEAQGRSARWWRRATVTLLALGVCLPLGVDALGPVPHTFSSGEVISASDMNENFAHLQDAITEVEGKVPGETCAGGQLSRFDGSSWVCSDDRTLTTSDPNLSISDGALTMAGDISVTSVQTGVVDARVSARWNNSAANGVTEMTVFGNDGTCNDTTRGRIRMWEHEDIGTSTDIGDALCFCQRYVDRTPATPVTDYRWVCLYPRSDGD